MPSFVPIYHSRAKAEADWECQRKRYYLYEFEDGIVKDNLTLDLFIGTCLHDALAAIAAQQKETGKVDIDTIAEASRKLVVDVLSDYYGEVPEESTEALLTLEQSTLVEALVRGFYKQIWPPLMEAYPTIVASEEPTIYPHGFNGKFSKKGPFVYRAKPDLVLEGPEGRIYFELKSTGSKKIEWINSWNKSTQVHGTAKAIEFTLGGSFLGTIVQGFYKGSTMYGKFSSPLVYCYSSPANPPFKKAVVTHEYRPGLKKSPVWELEGGVKKYVEGLPSTLLSEQFPQTPIIFTNEETAEDFFRQRAIREADIIESKQEMQVNPHNTQWMMDKTFPQSFNKCEPSFGHECPFLRICHGPAKEDPLSMGYIKKDKAHEEPYLPLVEKLLA